jgi:hypothetical protein
MEHITTSSLRYVEAHITEMYLYWTSPTHLMGVADTWKKAVVELGVIPVEGQCIEVLHTENLLNRSSICRRGTPFSLGCGVGDISRIDWLTFRGEPRSPCELSHIQTLLTDITTQVTVMVSFLSLYPFYATSRPMVVIPSVYLLLGGPFPCPMGLPYPAAFSML